MSPATRRAAPRLIVLSAPSGAGKTTLCKRLLADFLQLELSISSTTRPVRGSEQQGKDYHFLSTEEFQKLIAADRFAEWALVHGNYYGTSKDAIERSFAQGKSVLLDIDVQGAESLRKAYPVECFSIFISPPDLQTLESRLRSRGTDSEETIQKRLKNSIDEMKEDKHFHARVVNDDFEAAYAKLKTMVDLQLGSSS
ncbi:MAG: guanylate kinase [Methylotenera sp.]|nr:guanylate kinase [Oligoflexia bacterium]